MKIGVRHYPAVSQEVVIGDRVINSDNNQGEVIGFNPDNVILIKLDKGCTEGWDKDSVILWDIKEGSA